MTFDVQKKMCSTCIYRKDSPLDLKRLEDVCRDDYGGFTSYRVCHHTSQRSKICCRGFWNRHKDKFQLGQIAQRLGLVRFVVVDVLANKTPSRKKRKANQ